MYKKIIFFSLFLCNIALYMPSVGMVKADLAEQIIKKVDTTYVSKLSDQVATKYLASIYTKARDAKIAEFALDNGLNLEEYGQIFQGQFPSSMLEGETSAWNMQSEFTKLQETVENDMLRANFGLDQTLTSEAFNQYTQEMSKMLKQNVSQYQKMYKKAIQDMYKQVMDYYSKFPYPAVMSCT